MLVHLTCLPEVRENVAGVTCGWNADGRSQRVVESVVCYVLCNEEIAPLMQYSVTLSDSFTLWEAE